MTGLTPWQEEVYAQLDRTWKRLDEIAAGMNRELSGSGYENACDQLVEVGLAERQRPRERHVPMGKVYRRVAHFCWCGKQLVPSTSPLDREGALVCPDWSRGSAEPHDTYVRGET